MVYESIHRRLKCVQHWNGVKSCDPECWGVPVPLVVPVMLLVLEYDDKSWNTKEIQNGSYISSFSKYLRIDRNFCSIHEEITSIRLYTPCNPRLHGVYNLIDVIYAGYTVCTTWLMLFLHESNKNCDQSLNISKAICHALLELIDMSRGCLFYCLMSRGCSFYCLICHVVVCFIVWYVTWLFVPGIPRK
jgi:hypothetical protein